MLDNMLRTRTVISHTVFTELCPFVIILKLCLPHNSEISQNIFAKLDTDVAHDKTMGREQEL